MWPLVTTVADQAKQYTYRQVESAKQARNMQDIMMCPSHFQLAKSAIWHLANFPVTEHSIQIASDILGPNLGSLKGKTVYRPSPHVEPGIDPVPLNIFDRHRNVTLATGIMFVNKIPFLVTVSWNLKFLTVEGLPNRQNSTVCDKLSSVLKIYHHCGFQVTSILADPEFESLLPHFPFINTRGANKHVPDIERACCLYRQGRHEG